MTCASLSGKLEILSHLVCRYAYDCHDYSRIIIMCMYGTRIFTSVTDHH